MTASINIQVLSRRAFILSAAAAATLPSFIARAEAPSDLTRSELFEEAFGEAIGNATPIEGKITIDLPEIAENGNFVPITINVESPMTEEDHVKTVYLLSTSNPVARVATFHLKPINAVARIQSRMRLAKTQEVFVVAEMANSRIAAGSVLVKVTIGGCGG